MKPSRTFSQVKMEITAYSDFEGGKSEGEKNTKREWRMEKESYHLNKREPRISRDAKRCDACVRKKHQLSIIVLIG